jgi:hypothetical protein
MTAHCHDDRPPLSVREPAGAENGRQSQHKPSNWWAREREPWLADAALAPEAPCRLSAANAGAPVQGALAPERKRSGQTE